MGRLQRASRLQFDNHLLFDDQVRSEVANLMPPEQNGEGLLGQDEQPGIPEAISIDLSYTDSRKPCPSSLYTS